MSNTHTPGPWQNTFDGSFVYAPRKKGTDHGQLIAQVTAGEGMNTVENARLIAAAPELLEALEAIMSSHVDPDGLIYLPATGSILSTRARAAIAKARGE